MRRVPAAMVATPWIVDGVREVPKEDTAGPDRVETIAVQA